jgi:dTDP-4-dehydrorhamnose 3,5-epimerase
MAVRRAGADGLRARGAAHRVAGVHVEQTSIAGSWIFTPRRHSDDRGSFLELFTASSLEEATGRRLELAQANLSVSRAGAVRGVHYADVPPGQAKYVTCVTGSVLDVVVDLRVGSPTFGRHHVVQLDTVDQRAVFVSEGLGHAFVAMEDGSTVVYVCSSGYNPGAEHAVHPLDPELGITWPETFGDGTRLELHLSPKDAAAPSLAEAKAAGALPTYREGVTG